MGKGDIESLFEVVFMMLAIFLIAIFLWSIYNYSLLSGAWDEVSLNYIKVIVPIFGFGVALMYLIKRRR